jgi:hypothetical protein
MYSEPLTCTCGHADTLHLKKVGPCTHHKVEEFCGCDHFQRLRVQVLLSATISALPMKKTVLPAWSRQK